MAKGLNVYQTPERYSLDQISEIITTLLLYFDKIGY